LTDSRARAGGAARGGEAPPGPAPSAAGRERGPLSPRAARVFYSVADAWIPPRDGAPGGGDVDVVAALDALLPDPDSRRRLERRLALLEWSPRLALRSRDGFAWWPRAARRTWLDRWAARGPRPVRRALAELRALAERAHAAATSLPAAAGGHVVPAEAPRAADEPRRSAAGYLPGA
jgi:hypothetical protein